MSFFLRSRHASSLTAAGVNSLHCSRGLVCTAVLGSMLWLNSPVAAQLNLGPRPGDEMVTEGSGSRTQADGGNVQKLPPRETFRAMLNRIKFNEAEVNRLYSSMPLGFPKKQKQYLAQIDVMQTEVNQLRANLPAAALAAFKAAPGEDPAATQFVFQTLSEMIAPTMPDSVFDPRGALEIVDALIDAGAGQDPVVLSKGFRASFAIEDFDRAELMLDRIVESNPEIDLTQIRQDLESSQEKWQRELSIRRLEKNNDNSPRVKFTTTAGEFVVALYEDYAPNTVANFISLVEKKFYEDLTFHYVKPGEYAHTGCPNGDATGGPGYRIASEYDREQTRDFFAGTLGMANTGPDTEGSQFVITHQAIPQLDGRLTAFGRVIEGFDIVRSMKQIEPLGALPEGGQAAREPVKILKAEVVWKRDHEYEPERLSPPKADDSFDGLGSIGGPPERRSAAEDVPAVDAGLFTPSQR